MQNQEAAFEDRDLILLSFFEDAPDEEAARKQFGIEDGTFAVILIGKDGGERFRSTEPVGPRDLLGRIDAMPMRRREMRGEATC